jgi:hypothetical protein
MAVPWKAFCVVLGALSLIIAGLYLGRAGTPRVGVDWAHHQFMLPPGAELPIIPPPSAGANRIWYQAPLQKRWI